MGNVLQEMRVLVGVVLHSRGPGCCCRSDDSGRRTRGKDDCEDLNRTVVLVAVAVLDGIVEACHPRTKDRNLTMGGCRFIMLQRLIFVRFNLVCGSLDLTLVRFLC